MFDKKFASYQTNWEKIDLSWRKYKGEVWEQKIVRFVVKIMNFMKKRQVEIKKKEYR